MNFAILLECELCGARWVVPMVPPTLGKGCRECNSDGYPADADTPAAVLAHAARHAQIGRGERFIDGRVRLANPGRPC